MATRSPDATDAQVGTPDGQPAGEVAAPAKPAKPRQTVPVMLMLPPAFKTLLEEKAKAENTTVGSFARKQLADHLGYTLPALTTRQRGKYAHITDPEARKQAIAADQAKQRDDVKMLLEGVRTGKIDIEALRAQLAGGNA